MRATSSSGLGARAFSIFMVLLMVSTGFFIFVSVGPVAKEGSAEMESGADGTYGDGGDILIIWENWYTGANPNNPSDNRYTRSRAIAEDIRAVDDSIGIDMWMTYSYLGSYPYQPGQDVELTNAPGEYVHTYYPWDSIYGDDGTALAEYDLVILMGWGSMHWGLYYSYETSNQGATAMRSIRGLRDYMDNGGSAWIMNYYSGYDAYYPRVGASNQNEARAFIQDYFGTTTTYHYSYGYSVRGIDDTTPNTGDDSVGIDPETGNVLSFNYYDTPMSYAYHRYYQNPIPSKGGVGCWEGSYSTNTWYNPPRYAGIQCDDTGGNGGKSLYMMWDMYYTRYVGLPDYYHFAAANDEGRQAAMQASLDFLMDGGPGCQPESLAVSEIYDEGTKGEDQFVELYNPLKGGVPIDVSNFYLSVLESPTGEGDEYGSWDLETLDFDKNDNDLLDADEFLIVQDSELDLGIYKYIGVYNKIDNVLAYQVGWSHAGGALDPVAGMSTQVPWDNDNGRYIFGEWTLASPTKAARNIIAVPDFESGNVVINEVNPGYVELYNTGGSQLDISGYKLAGYRNVYTFPIDSTIAAGGYLTVTNSKVLIADNGGDMKLFNELGVLRDVITWAPADTRAENSYAARHFDGVGVRDVYEPGQGSTYLRKELDQPNSWWELDVAATEAVANYHDVTILIDGMGDIYHYLNNTDDLGDGAETYKGGILEADVTGMATLANWDVVLFNGDVDDNVAQKLGDYLQDGGRLYIESDDFQTIGQDQENFYDMLHIRSFDFTAGTLGESVIAGDLFAEGMEFKYGGSVSERVDPLDDGFRIIYQKSASANRFAAGYIENPTTGYRVVSSALEAEEFLADKNQPTDVLDALLEWLLTEDLNSAPVLELIDGGQVGSTALTANDAKLCSLGWLGWENNDPDYWDLGRWETQDAYDHDMYKFVDFTVYIDQDEDKVGDLEETCTIVAETNTTFYMPSGLEPGQYFWTVRAKDTFGAVGGDDDEWGDPIVYNFFYDNKKPMLDSIKPYFQSSRGVANVGSEMLGYYVENGEYPTFGPGGEGKPQGILFAVSDEHLGVAFDGSPRTNIDLRFVSQTPGVEGKTFEMVPLMTKTGGAIETQNEDNMAEFILDLGELTLAGDMSFLDDDGTLRNGRYTIMYEVYDFVGNHIEGTLVFTVDADAPLAVVDLAMEVIDHPIYENTGVSYLKAGETYRLSGTGPTTTLDGTLNGIAFYMVDKLSNPTPVLLGSFSGNDLAGAEETQRYDVEFEAIRDYEFFYAVTVDRAGNEVVSVFLGSMGNYVVDAYAPTRPSNIEMEQGVQKYVTVSGWARDSQVADKTSKMSYVLIYVNEEVVSWENDGVYDWLGGMEYQAGDEMKVRVLANQFSARVPLTPISSRDGDIKNQIQVRGVDNVGNKGELSVSTELAPIRMLDPQKSMNVAVTQKAIGLSDGVDQLKDMSVTFLQFPPGDFEYHTIAMTYHAQTPDVDVSAIPMVGYWTVDTDVSGDFTARIRIEFQHPSISAFDFESLKLISKSNADNKWQTITNAVFVHQEANPAAGIPEMWYVEATVSGFSDFGIIQGKPDLQIVDTHIFANPMVGGQTVRISARVANLGQYAAPVEGVKVRVYYVDEAGAESTIDWIEFEEPLLPGVHNHQTGEVIWETPVITDEETATYFVRFKLDPDAEISEYNETNNNGVINEDNAAGEDPLKIIRVSYSVPSFVSTIFMLVLASMLVTSCVVVGRKRRL